jgi:hypothetical protein
MVQQALTHQPLIAQLPTVHAANSGARTNGATSIHPPAPEPMGQQALTHTNGATTDSATSIDPLTIEAARTNGATTDDATSIDPLTIDATNHDAINNGTTTRISPNAMAKESERRY